MTRRKIMISEYTYHPRRAFDVVYDVARLTCSVFLLGDFKLTIQNMRTITLLALIMHYSFDGFYLALEIT